MEIKRQAERDLENEEEEEEKRKRRQEVQRS
jgi:hypothetical protein